MIALVQALERISNWLESNDSHFAQKMQQQMKPGLSPEEIEQLVNKLPFRLPEEVYQIYQWRNGDMYMGERANPVYFISLSEAVYQQASFSNRVESPYFPVFLGDGFAYVVRGATERQKYSLIHEYDTDLLICGEVISPNLANIMQAVAECLEIYGFTSAASMAASDDSCTSEEIFNELYKKYSSLIFPIYKKYRLEDIWG